MDTYGPYGQTIGAGAFTTYIERDIVSEKKKTQTKKTCSPNKGLLLSVCKDARVATAASTARRMLCTSKSFVRTADQTCMLSLNITEFEFLVWPDHSSFVPIIPAFELSCINP